MRRLYTIHLRGSELAAAETFRGAILALRTLRHEVDAPAGMVARSPRGSDVAGIGPDGVTVTTFQGSELWA
jgi:hypothetical protein